MIRKWIYKLRYILIILSAILGLMGLSSSFGICLDYGLGNNGVDYCYDVGNVYYLPGNTTERNVGFQFDSNGNFLTPMNYAGGVVQLYSNLYYHAYGRKNGNFIKLNNTNNNSGNEWIFSGACLGSLQNEYLSSYGARAYVGEPCASSVLISYSSFSNLDLWGNIDMILMSFVNERILFCYASSSVDQVLCFNEYGGITVQENAVSPDGVSAPYNFVNIGSDFFGRNPFVSIPGGDGDSSFDYDLTNDQVLKSYFDMGFTKNICYGGKSVSGDYSVAIPGTGKSMFQLYQEFNPTGIDNIVDRYSYYRNGYIDYPQFTYSGGSYITDPNSPFLNNGNFMLSLYRLFLFNNRFGVSIYDSYSIVEFCDLLINKNNNQVYTGEIENSTIKNIIYNNYYSLMFSGYDDYIQWETGAVASMSGETFTGGYNSFFERLTKQRGDHFGEYNKNIVGIIPSYILYFMFALILIRMISK